MISYNNFSKELIELGKLFDIKTETPEGNLTCVFAGEWNSITLLEGLIRYHDIKQKFQKVDRKTLNELMKDKVAAILIDSLTFYYNHDMKPNI